MFCSYTDSLLHLENDSLVWLFAFREHWICSFAVLYVLGCMSKIYITIDNETWKLPKWKMSMFRRTVELSLQSSSYICLIVQKKVSHLSIVNLYRFWQYKMSYYWQFIHVNPLSSVKWAWVELTVPSVHHIWLQLISDIIINALRS